MATRMCANKARMFSKTVHFHCFCGSSSNNTDNQSKQHYHLIDSSPASISFLIFCAISGFCRCLDEKSYVSTKHAVNTHVEKNSGIYSFCIVYHTTSIGKNKQRNDIEDIYHEQDTRNHKSDITTYHGQNRELKMKQTTRNNSSNRIYHKIG